jgi:hypothetical protein
VGLDVSTVGGDGGKPAVHSGCGGARRPRRAVTMAARGRAALGGVAVVAQGEETAEGNEHDGTTHPGGGEGALPSWAASSPPRFPSSLTEVATGAGSARRRWRCNARRAVSSQSREANGHVILYASPDHCSIQECSGRRSGQCCSHFLAPDPPNVSSHT